MLDYEKLYRERKRSALMPEPWIRMVPQDTLVQTDFPKGTTHNAIWDYNVSPEGRHYLSLCAECNNANYVHFYEFLPKEKELKLLFKLDERLIVQDRTIRPSKIHTSINFMEDGRILMSTHTTAMAPAHPYWLPYSFYSHPWEGYLGSNLLIYDPKSGKLEDLGVPVPRESIYGGVYVPETRCFYFLGYMRGHLYRFRLEDRDVKDYGQVLEYGVYNIQRHRDGNVYFASRTGLFQRINVQTEELETLGHLPWNGERAETIWHNLVLYVKDGPDGKMYIAPGFTNEMAIYDYDTGRLTRGGHFMPAGLEALGTNRKGAIYGMDFDEQGVLWYGLTTSADEYGTNFYLCSWDITRGGEPICHGLMGRPEQLCATLSELFIRDGLLTCSNTNYVDYPPSMLSATLDSLRGSDVRHPETLGPVTTDTYFWCNHTGCEKYMDPQVVRDAFPRYAEYDAFWAENAKVEKANENRVPMKGWVIKPWHHTPRVDESAVRRVWYTEDGLLHAVCGTTEFTHFACRNAVIKYYESCVAPAAKPVLREKYKGLPCYPGRQFRAVATAEAILPDGRALVGTEDGFLALVDGKHVQNLGMVCVGGPVHDLALAPNGKFAVGVAGDPDDIGMVFLWKPETGVRLLGRCSLERDDLGDGAGYNCNPTSVAVSPDSRFFAVGCSDRMGGIYQFPVE